MAKISFRIKDPEKNTKKVREKASIRVRLNQFEISTGITVLRKHWSSAKQEVKRRTGIDYSDEVNNKLDELKTHLNKEIAIAQANDKNINQVWFSNCVRKFFNKPTSEQSDADIYFGAYMQEYIKRQSATINKKTGKPRAKRTIIDYETKLRKLTAFEAKKGVRLKNTDINLKFLKDFLKYMNEDLLVENYNTLKGYVDIYKQVCRNAKRNGIKVHNDIEHPDFFVPTQPTYDFALKETEINTIYNHDFSNDERLDNVRDWFIIGLWTGLRISDFLHLNNSHIEDGFITIFNKKTNIPVIVPLHEQVEAILKKRKGKFPRHISDQKFNEYVKEVCQAVGMTEKIQGSKMMPITKGKKTVYRKKVAKYPKHELVSSHICRRTFATIHYGRLDTLAIMQITGHKTEKQFLDYVKIPPKIYAERLKKLWIEQREFAQQKQSVLN